MPPTERDDDRPIPTRVELTNGRFLSRDVPAWVYWAARDLVEWMTREGIVEIGGVRVRVRIDQ